jgi:prepilin-type N-terminal cleavage/methylation domain-containing protein
LVKAFTLLELLIVMVILGLAATLAVPLVADQDSSGVQAAARLLTADLGYAQLEAISHADDRCRVTFDMSAGSYTLSRNSAPASPIAEPITGQPYATQFGAGRAAQAAGVAIQGYSLGGDNYISFGRYGELDQSTTATISLRRGAVTLTIQIDPTTGEVALISP